MSVTATDHAKVLRRWARAVESLDLRTVLLASASEIERLNDEVRPLAEQVPQRDGRRRSA